MAPLLVLLFLLVGSVKTGGFHPVLLDVKGDMVLYDWDADQPFCYPDANDPSQNIFRAPLETVARSNGRVLCRSFGYTHLVREYSISFSGITGRPLMYLCRGYERLIEQCQEFNNTRDDCDELLALECGTCSIKRKVEFGETLEITSPEYPNYTDAAVCEWHLQASARASFMLQFLTFTLPNTDNSGNCYMGFLEVLREVAKERVEEMMRCGSAVPTPTTLEADTLILRLSSGTFYPRPYNSQRGFKALIKVSPIAWSSRSLGTMESVCIGLGVALFLVVSTVLFIVARRRRWMQRRSRQRRRMKERLAAQRPSYSEASASEQERCQGVEQWGRDLTATRTRSVPLQMTNCLNQPPLHPSSAPVTARRCHHLHSLASRQVSQRNEEQHIYMEVDEFTATPFQAYVQLHELNRPRDETLHPASSAGCPVTSSGLLAPSTRCSSSQPHISLSQPSSPSSTLEKMFSNKLNTWPNSSSISPSIKTLSSTGNATKSSMGSHINYFVRSVSSRSSNMSSNLENASPFTSQTPTRHLHLSVKPYGCTSSGNLSPCSPINGNNMGPVKEKQLPEVYLDGTPLLTKSVLEQRLRGIFSSSCDSVFSDGSVITSPNHTCTACGSSPGSVKRPLTIDQRQHLSKSCGDLTYQPTIPKQRTSMMELVQSEPSLPRDQASSHLVGPVLRRVSQMFFSSSPFLLGSLDSVKTSQAAEVNPDADKRESRTWRLRRTASRRALSTPSGVFLPFRYNRLENFCNNETANLNCEASNEEPNMQGETCEL